MYGARLSELWGVTEAIQQMFVFEKKLALAVITEPVFQAREQSTGMRMWVKLSDGTEESNKRLSIESDMLRSLNHPHIMDLKIDKRDWEVPFIGFPWHAETPLADVDMESISDPDRIRLAISLLEIIDYMQTLDDPVSHGRINTENLWITPTSGWIRLASFGHAMVSPLESDLLTDREQALNLVSDILGKNENGEELKDKLIDTGVLWIESPDQSVSTLSSMLRKSFLTSVTSDLHAIT